MSTTTQCPVCGTRFRASQAQLEAYQGMVRCGNCHAAFNAVENRTSEEPSPQLDLPIMQEGAVPEDEMEASELVETEGVATVVADAERAAAEAERVPAVAKRVPAVPPAREPTAAEVDKEEEELEEEESAEPADTLSFLAEKKKPRPSWRWVVADVALLLLLLGQGIYMFRVDLAAQLPGIKPMLVSACTELGCTVPLPRNIDLMDIESSNLETDPAKPGIITLDVTLRNLAHYAQAYPDIELTLTDYNEVPVGRRVLHPAEYLKAAQAETTGLAAKRTHNIRLAMDASALKPAGYKLFLYY